MTESSQAPLLKTDVLGRVKTPAARREQLLDEFERSGTSGQKFADLVGVKYQTFATWVQQRKRRRAASVKRKTPRSAAKVRWLEATVSPDDGHDGNVTGSVPQNSHVSIIALGADTAPRAGCFARWPAFSLMASRALAVKADQQRRSGILPDPDRRDARPT